MRERITQKVERRTRPLDHAFRRAQGREHGRTARAALSEVEGRNPQPAHGRSSLSIQKSEIRNPKCLIPPSLRYAVCLYPISIFLCDPSTSLGACLCVLPMLRKGPFGLR